MNRRRSIASINVGQIAVASLLLTGLASSAVQAGSPSSSNPQGYKAISMKADLAHRSPAIHWPAGFEPDKADLFAHNEQLINASCERVWTHIVDAGKWPAWYPNSRDVQIQGGEPVLQDGSVFRWTTFGLAIESKVHEYVPNQRLGWYGYAPGAQPSFYHSWYLEPKGAMCRVVMDEAGIGKDAAGLRQSDETLMHRGHALWLATLKWVAEAK
ncbi:MAG: Polyketide cyclase/dehydrase [Nevskia sp.]|nr:Polyketide cyclase/dehydrase [Nevskia sp.]